MARVLNNSFNVAVLDSGRSIFFSVSKDKCVVFYLADISANGFFIILKIHDDRKTVVGAESVNKDLHVSLMLGVFVVLSLSKCNRSEKYIENEYCQRKS